MTLLERIQQIKFWQRGDERAPHNLLLLLLALASVRRGQAALPFVEVEAKLTELLREFGPSRDSYSPQYQFWRLQNDGLWVVSADRRMTPRANNSDPARTELRDAHAVGQFAPDVKSELLQSPQLQPGRTAGVNGSGIVEDVLLRHHGRKVELPRRADELPRQEFLAWHAKPVFKGRALP